MGFKQTNMDAAHDKLKEVASGVPFFTPDGKDGKWTQTRIRILPPRDDHPDDTYFYWVATHGNLPGAGRPIYCPSKNDGAPCPACDIANALYRQGKKDDANQIASSWKALMNVVVLNKDGSWPDDAIVRVWGPSRQLFEKLDAKVQQLKDDEPDRYDITHPFNGSDVVVNRYGASMKKTEYEVAIVPVSTEVPPEKYDLFDAMHSLPHVYQTTDGLAIQQYLDGGKAATQIPGAFDEDADPRGAGRPALPEGRPDVVEGEYTDLSALFSKDDDEDEDEDNNAPPAESTPDTVRDAARAALAAQLRG